MYNEEDCDYDWRPSIVSYLWMTLGGIFVVSSIVAGAWGLYTELGRADASNPFLPLVLALALGGIAFIALGIALQCGNWCGNCCDWDDEPEAVPVAAPVPMAAESPKPRGRKK